MNFIIKPSRSSGMPSAKGVEFKGRGGDTKKTFNENYDRSFPSGEKSLTECVKDKGYKKVYKARHG